MTADLADIASAAKFTARFASAGPLDRSYLLDDLERHFAELVREAEPLIEEETGFVVPSPAVPVVVNRAEWAAANVESMLTMMGPVLKKLERRIAVTPMSTVARMAYRPALGAQLGAVLGFLSQRVLGQYDLLLGRESNVYFVGSNIVMLEKRFGFIPRDFRLWIVLHELTHRSQFEGNPWMREHFLASVDQLVSGLDIDARHFFTRAADALRANENSTPLGLRLLSSEQRERFDKLQAFMSVVEGHGNFVMDRIAESVIPTQPRMRQVLRSAPSSGGPISKLLSKLLGLEMKRAQYEQGQAFFDHLYRVGGRDLVRSCFTSVDALPTLEQVRNPELWIARTAP